MKKHYLPYFKSSPPINSPQPPYFYKNNFISPYKVSFENFHPLLRKMGGANYGFIYRNKYPPVHFIFTFPPNLKKYLSSFISPATSVKHKWERNKVSSCHVTSNIKEPEKANHIPSNGWVFVYELSGSGFESSCSHLNFSFKQRVPWHSGSCRVWIHSETRAWHDKNIQFLRFLLKKTGTGFSFVR